MTREEILERLTEVFTDIFDDEEISINDETTSDDIEGWDSLAHINLIAAVEGEFKVQFNMDKIPQMKNVGMMVNMIMEKIK